MKALALIGSRRKNGNSKALVDAIIAPLKSHGNSVETCFLGDHKIGACTGCEMCADSWTCVIDDDFSTIVSKIDEADTVILASPTYWYSVTSDTKRFIDRCYSLIQYPVNRQEWVGKYGGLGKKGVTVAVCEQADETMMGNTSTLLAAFLEDLGIPVFRSVKAVGYFEAGSVGRDVKLMASMAELGTGLTES